MGVMKMVKTTKQQRETIKRKADQSGMSYRTLRRELLPTFGCDGAVTVHWRGMWLCIEQDGYCHT